MKIVFTTLKRTLFWSYERGTWQYDVMCVLILAFIFLTPNWFFESHRKPQYRDTLVRSDNQDKVPLEAAVYRDGTAQFQMASSTAEGPVEPPVPVYFSSASKTSSKAGESRVDQLLSKMHDAGRLIKTYRAKVLQERRFGQIGGGETHRGDLSFKHEPQNRDKVRMTYYDSDGAVNQDVLIDGDKVILYQPRINQAVETSRRAQAQKNPEFDFIATPYTSVASLKDHYTISYPRDENLGSISTAVLELVPKVRGSITGYTLWIDQSSSLPIKYKAVAQNRDTTSLTLSEISINPKLPEKTFKLDLPKGTRLVTK